MDIYYKGENACGGGSGGLVFDENERIIGKWFGQDLYCRAFHVESNSLASHNINEQIQVGTLERPYNICMLSCVNNKTDLFTTPVPIEYATDLGKGVYYSIAPNGEIKMKFSSNSQKNGEIWICVFYTKPV